MINAGRASGLDSKVLVIMSDSRRLETNKATAGYHSLATYVNSVYCKRYGYDFLYFRLRPISFWASVQDAVRRGKSLVKRLVVRAPRQPQERTYSYNTLLKEPRGASWTKLVAARDALALNYSTVVYIDSDCVFRDHDTSLEKFVETTPLHRGSAFANSCVGFLKNFPWTEDLPCAGFFVAKNTPETMSFLRDWWNFPNPLGGFAFDWEQSSLRELYPAVSDRLCVWDALFFVEQEGQFLRHVGSNQAKLRHPYFLEMVNTLERASNGSFESVIGRVTQRSLSSYAW